MPGNGKTPGRGRSIGESVGFPARLEMDAPNDPRSVAFVRRAVVSATEVCGADVSGAAGLIVSELVTNALRHAALGADARIGVELTVTPEGISGHVVDPGPGFDPGARSPPSADGGFGLLIVQRLARGWGVDRTGGRTRVWFEL